MVRWSVFLAQVPAQHWQSEQARQRQVFQLLFIGRRTYSTLSWQTVLFYVWPTALFWSTALFWPTALF
jgi:hypothetical protein